MLAASAKSIYRLLIYTSRRKILYSYIYMDGNVKFFSYQQGLITLSPNDIAKAMYKDASVPIAYDYKDLITGLSFQLITPTKLFVVDESFPVNKLIPTAKWQVLYDASFNGPGNVKFVMMGQDATVQSNWKTLNDVLQYHLYAGTLPVQDLESVYMKLITLDDSMYIVGTLFTPSQPYVRLVLTGTQTVASNAEARIAYNSIDDQVGVEEADSAQMVPVLTGANTGVVRLKVAGLYLIEADASLTVTAATVARLAVKINGTSIRKITSFSIPATGGDNPFWTTAIRIKRSDLADTTFADEAKLEITLTNTSSASTTISSGSAELTALTVTFLG